MSRKPNFTAILVAAVFVLWGMVSGSGAADQGTLRYSRSAHICQAFGKAGLEAFTMESGIKVESYISSSASAVYRLMNDFSDIASTTRELYRRHRDYGYVQIPFCKDLIAILTNAQNPVVEITEFQLQDIFGGNITNWQELGGPDQPIVVVVPGEITGAYKNFVRQVMKRKEIAKKKGMVSVAR
ncbi:MAG: substrate-binding domain-containing protein [Desulfobacterales bacterium]|jgi:phosphate transport system substrate-binding protein